MATTSDDLEAAIWALYLTIREREWPPELVYARRMIGIAAKVLFPGEYLRQQHASWRIAHPELRRWQRERWRARHVDPTAEQARKNAYKQRHRHQVNEQERVSRARRRNEIRERSRLQRAARRDLVNKQKRDLYAANRDKTKKRAIIRLDELTPDQRRLVLALIEAGRAVPSLPTTSTRAARSAPSPSSHPGTHGRPVSGR